ncbi:MAG: phage holin family protein [Polyangiales bacterium]
MDLLVSWLVLALGLYLSNLLLDDMKVEGGFGSYMIVAALFGVLNFFVGWLVQLVVGVASLFILFFFSFVLRLIADAIVLKMTSGLSTRLQVKGFGTALVAALVMSGTHSGAEWALRQLH